MTKLRKAGIAAIAALAFVAAFDESNIVGLVARKAIALIQAALASPFAQ